MHRKLTILFLISMLTTSLLAQTVTMSVKVHGVSPRDVAKSTTDIYTYASTGLNNVGVGSLVYLKVSMKGKKLGTITWSFTRRAPGSTATVATTADKIDKINDSTWVYTFTPDKVGPYELKATDGAYSASVSFHAAKYLGYTNTFVDGVNKNVNCQTCHSSYVTKWSKTNHATIFTRAMNATPGLSGPNDHYSVNCISCHTTGFDKNPTAVNDGFDDLPFTYPTVLTNGTYNQLVAQFPDAMMRGNIQCESCHGPASGHVGVTSDNRIVATYDEAVCAYCHDAGTHHVFPAQWDLSRHAVATDYASGPGRESCVRCHTGKGFAQFAQNISTTNPYFDPSYTPITCAGCHDPHDNTLPHQLRMTDATFIAAGFKPTEGGLGKICMNCHQSRYTADDAYVAPKTSYTRFGTHYSDPANIMSGTNVYTFGKTLTRTNHLKLAEDGCVTCHMGETDYYDATGVPMAGKHSFSMRTPQGQSNFKPCATCHGYSLGADFSEVKFFPKGQGDIDMDGTVEGLQAEVRGLMDLIVAKLPVKTSDWAHEDPTSTWTKVQLQAFFNVKALYYDGSFGIHDPKFTVTLLQETYKQLGGVVSVDENISIPTEYELYQNYPNPFNPTTNIKFSLPKASNVKLTIYDAVGREVRTVVNNYLSAGVHNIEFNARNLASGVYLYRIEADNFVKTNKMLLLK